MNEREFPGEIELVNVPHYALIAFAVRCAMRVQPLFDTSSHADRQKHLLAVADAIERASSINLDSISTRFNCDTAAERAFDAAMAACDVRAELAARAAARAARTASRLGRTAILNAAKAVSTSIAAGSDSLLESAIWSDYRLLPRSPKDNESGENAAGEKLDVSDEGFFGPLWPDGPPTWYIEKKAKLELELTRIRREQADEVSDAPLEILEPAAPLSLYFDSKHFTKEEIGRILGDLSDLYHSIGGDQLIIDDITFFAHDRVLEEV